MKKETYEEFIKRGGAVKKVETVNENVTLRDTLSIEEFRTKCFKGNMAKRNIIQSSKQKMANRICNEFKVRTK